MRRVAWLLIVGLAPALAAAQQLGPVLPPAPAAIEAAPPDAPPMAIRQQDAERLAPPPRPPAVPPPPPTSSATVQVSSEARPPENDTPGFLFRDVTERSSPSVKTLPERAAAVEALRRSLGRPAGGPPR